MTGRSDADIKALCDAATPGPWQVRDGGGYQDVPIRVPGGEYLCCSPDDGVRGGHRRADAEFIAAARDLVPALLARAQQAEADQAELLAAHEQDLAENERLANEVDRLRAELAEARAENERLRVPEAITEAAARLAAASVLDVEVARHALLATMGVIAERDALAVKVRAVEALCDEAERWPAQWRSVPPSRIRAALAAVSSEPDMTPSTGAPAPVPPHAHNPAISEDGGQQ